MNKYNIKFGIKKIKKPKVLHLPFGISSLYDFSVEDIIEYDMVKDMETGIKYNIKYFIRKVR